MPALLAVLRGRIKEKEILAIDHVAEAARAAAAGRTYDLAALESALAQRGMTIADFEKAVETAKKRALWLSRFDGLAAATTRANKLEAAIRTEEQKLEEQRLAVVAKVGKIRQELEIVTANRNAGDAAKAELLNPDNVPGSIGDRYRNAYEALREAESAVDAATRKVREQAEKIRSAERWIEQFGRQPRQLQPDRILTLGGEPAPTESVELRDHRTALARAQRRKAEADAELATAEDAAAAARIAVEEMIPEVLKA